MTAGVAEFVAAFTGHVALEGGQDKLVHLL